jgi:hypothetical protein
MPLQKLQFRPGLNREGTDYSNEGGWYDGDKIRFRSGFPEKIGGWTQVNSNQYLGVARSLWVWLNADQGAGSIYTGVGTNVKYYIFYGGVYNDITPYVKTNTLTSVANTISTQSGSPTVTITDASGYGFSAGDYVTITSTTVVNGVQFTGGNYLIQSTPTPTTFTVTFGGNASATGTGTGGTVTLSYNYPTGLNIYSIGTGWGAGPWGGPSIPAATTLGANPFAITNGSTTCTVTHTAHGLSNGAYVAFSGATTIGGAGSNITAALLNATYVISGVTTNTYNITLPYAANATAAAGSPGGGSAVVETDQYGTRGWNTSFGTSSSSGASGQLRLWSADNFGSDLVLAPRNGSQVGSASNIYYWQDSLGVSARAQSLSDLANSTVVINDTGASVPNTGTSMTVSASVAPYIYPYMVVSGNTNIPAGTKVASTYITGATTVPLTNTLTGSGTVAGATFSYAGSFVPTSTYQVITSEVQEFVITFGANPYSPNNSATSFNPMLVRWSDQANPYQWVPTTANQSGEYTLTNGSFIMGARATRQEILVWTDSAIYSMQYLGAPYVWGFQILMDNISIMSPNSMITVNNVTYWMGRDRFYMYSGRVEVLPCALRQYIFADINQQQTYQVFAGANEAFNEVWWFYVSASSSGTIIDKYVIYNYLDRVWYYGTWDAVNTTAGSFVTGQTYVISSVGTTNFMLIGAASNTVGSYFIASGPGTGTGTAFSINGRSAWLQTGTVQYPIAADYNNRLLYHENGNDDNATATTQPIYSYVQSSDFDIGDGHNFGFVWRILPDVNFNGSSVNNPTVTMTVKPRQNSGTPYGNADTPSVQSSQNYATFPEYTIQQFTGQVYTRLRGRQMSFKLESFDKGVAWQLGSPRIDIRPDGRR